MSKSITFKEVQDFIWDADEKTIRTMYDLMHDRAKQLRDSFQHRAAKQFKAGDTVFFIKGKRSPRVIAGTLVRVSDTVAYLATPDFTPGRYDYNWRVSPSLLQHHTPGK